MTNRTPASRFRTLRLCGALVGLSAALGACANTGAEVVTASVPDDYRLRHPIAIHEADRSVVIFVGHARGGLSASQRADVLGLAGLFDNDVMRSMIRLVGDEKDPDVRSRAARVLMHLGPRAREAVPALLRAQKDHRDVRIIGERNSMIRSARQSTYPVRIWDQKEIRRARLIESVADAAVHLIRRNGTGQ